MASIDKFYSIFEKEKLRDILDVSYKKKSDLTWISLAMTIISVGIILYKNWQQYLTFIENKNSVPIYFIILSTIISIILLGLIAWFLYSFINWIHKRFFSINAFKKLVFSAEIKHEHNFVFIIKTKINVTPMLLFIKKSNWGYVLPYHTSDGNLSNTQLEDFLLKIFPDFKVTIKMIEQFKLDNVIKKKPEDGYTKISYNFCHVLINSNFNAFKNHIDKAQSLVQYVFKSLDELKNDLLTMKTNSDIVNYLAEESIFINSDDSFINITSKNLPQNLKVIWNITDQCSFNCQFCATKRNTTSGCELSFEDRLLVAEELSNLNGIRIDYAGGDPLNDMSAKRAITHITKYMIKNDVTITSTGIGFDKTDISELLNQFSHFDISYDYPSTWPNTHRGENYNELNFQLINKLINSGARVNILITLSNHNTSTSTITAMINELKRIDHISITLLRLMPVGKQKYEDYPELDKYNPCEAITLFTKEFGQKVKLHCSFRAYLTGAENCYCTMLHEKAGIDNKGNLFACAWAGYLQVDNCNNPFYLGNIRKEGVEKIFKSREFVKISRSLESGNNKFCRIFSFSENPKKGFDSNCDKYIEQYHIEQ